MVLAKMPEMRRAVVGYIFTDWDFDRNRIAWKGLSWEMELKIY